MLSFVDMESLPNASDGQSKPFDFDLMLPLMVKEFDNLNPFQAKVEAKMDQKNELEVVENINWGEIELCNKLYVAMMSGKKKKLTKKKKMEIEHLK
jgi:hypothetical protein